MVVFVCTSVVRQVVNNVSGFPLICVLLNLMLMLCVFTIITITLQFVPILSIILYCAYSWAWGRGGGVCESRGWYLISYLQLNVYCLLAYLLMFIYLYLFNELILYVFIYLIFMDRFVFAVHQPFYYTAYAAHYVYMYVCTVY